MISKIFKGVWLILALALVVWCMGCSDNDNSITSEQGDDFHHTPPADVQTRIEDLKTLLEEKDYNTITAGSRDNNLCKERNRGELGLPDVPNGQWYYTYENLIKGMAEWEEFANVGDDNVKKLEIAAFLANIAQETGTNDGDKFGGPGCFIQEGDGANWPDCSYGGCNKTRPFKCPDWPNNQCPDGETGYCGRGPHQLSWDYNYKAFGEDMDLDPEKKNKDLYFKNPDLLTTEPKTGIAGSIWFWGHADWSTGRDIPFKPSAHDVLVGEWTPTDEDVACGRTEANFGVIINIINGGLECGTTATADGRRAAKNRVKYLEAIAEEMGVTIPEGFLDDCSSQKNFAQCPSY